MTKGGCWESLSTMVAAQSVKGDILLEYRVSICSTGKFQWISTLWSSQTNGDYDRARFAEIGCDGQKDFDVAGYCKNDTVLSVPETSCNGKSMRTDERMKTKDDGVTCEVWFQRFRAKLRFLLGHIRVFWSRGESKWYHSHIKCRLYVKTNYAAGSTHNATRFTCLHSSINIPRRPVVPGPAPFSLAHF